MVSLVSAQPSLAAEVAALCKDQDMRIAIAALLCTKVLLWIKGRASACMLAADAARNVVSALYHSDRYCRAAAAAAAAGVFRPDIRHAEVILGSSKPLIALLEAGLVPALLDVVGAGRIGYVQGPSAGVLSNFKVQMQGLPSTFLLPNSEPALHACNALALLTRTWKLRHDSPAQQDRDAAILLRVEVAVLVMKTPEAAAVLVRCLRQFDGEVQQAPGQVIANVLRTVYQHGDISHAACNIAFCEELQKAGLLDLMPNLIRPGAEGITTFMLESLRDILDCLTVKCLQAPALQTLAFALANYVEQSPGGELQDLQNRATYCLSRVLARYHKIQSNELQLSERCIRNVAGAMVSGGTIQAWAACVLVVRQAKGDRLVAVVRAALSGGFVRGALRMGQFLSHGSVAPDLQDDFFKFFCDALILIAGCGEEQCITEAVDSNLFGLLKSLFGRPQCQEDILTVCAKLLESPWALIKIWEADFVSAVTQAADDKVKLGLWVSTTPAAKVLVDDFVAAGFAGRAGEGKESDGRAA